MDVLGLDVVALRAVLDERGYAPGPERADLFEKVLLIDRAQQAHRAEKRKQDEVKKRQEEEQRKLSGNG